MTWFGENWIWVIFAVGFVAMHTIGHGGHGKHRGRGRHRDGNRYDTKSVKGRTTAAPKQSDNRHRH